MTTLYNLHTDGDQYRITKFIDGDVESSYLLTEQNCECPAGHRASCRHRQMIPEMIARGLVNTHWFWNFDQHCAVDFTGSPKALFDNLAELAAEPMDEFTIDSVPSCGQENRTVGEAQHQAVKTTLPRTTWRRL